MLVYTFKITHTVLGALYLLTVACNHSFVIYDRK